MLDLSQLEKRMQQDKDLRDEFLKDPVAVLNKEGLILTPEMEKSLRQSVADAAKKVAGARPGGIMISINIPF